MHSLEEAVVDANVVIHSRGQIQVKSVYLPISVREEIESSLADMKIEKLNIQVVQPGEKSLEKVREKSKGINSPTSEQDEEALALAIEKNIPLLTDDKALQNLALHLDAEFVSFNTEGVSEKWKWKSVCENCGREEASPPCSRCGCDSLRLQRVRKS